MELQVSGVFGFLGESGADGVCVVWVAMKNLVILLVWLPLLATAQESRNVTLLGHWDTTGLPVNGSGAFYNEVWGFEINGEEYGVMGSTIGSHIIHLKGNNNLEEVAFIPGPQQGIHVVHRDYATYEHYLLCVGDQEPAKLQVVDLSNLPHSVEVVYESSEFVTRSHNVWVDEPAARAYLCGTNQNALEIVDLTNPEQPELLLEFNDVSYVHDCYVRGDTAWLNTGNPGLAVVDFTDLNNPQFLATLDGYPDDGYNHSGWLDPSGEWYCFADETLESSMKLCNVADLTDIQISDFFDSGNSTFIAHNLIMRDHLIFVSHYFDGLQVFDWSNPDDVRRIAWYDTSIGDDLCCRGAWGIYPLLPSGRVIISDRQRGMFLFDVMGDGPGELSIAVSPNPASEVAEVNLIEFGFDWRQGTLQVHAADGRLMADRTIENPKDLQHWIELDVSTWSTGLYVITVQIGNEVARANLVHTAR